MIKSIYLFLLFSPTMVIADMGALLFNGNCATCHHIHKASSAPTIIEIQKRYKKAFPDKKQFVEYMSKWVVNPNAATSLMSDKIAKYGLMPHLGFDTSTTREIAEYIYNGNIEATTR